jgi:hypothetical protein
MKVTFVLLFFIILQNNAFCSWGLPKELIVESCNSKAIGRCENFKGRTNQSNGSASIVIWKVGTKRIISWGAATSEANNFIKDKLDFSHKLFADFTACPMEKDIRGKRTQYCVEKIQNPKWVKTDQ